MSHSDIFVLRFSHRTLILIRINGSLFVAYSSTAFILAGLLASFSTIISAVSPIELRRPVRTWADYRWLVRRTVQVIVVVHCRDEKNKTTMAEGLLASLTMRISSLNGYSRHPTDCTQAYRNSASYLGRSTRKKTIWQETVDNSGYHTWAIDFAKMMVYRLIIQIKYPPGFQTNRRWEGNREAEALQNIRRLYIQLTPLMIGIQTQGD